MPNILKVLAVLFSILGIMACTTTTETTSTVQNPASSSYSVELKITNATDYEGCSFKFKGTLDGNYLSISDTGSDVTKITLSKGKLDLQVVAEDGEQIMAIGEIKGFEINKNGLVVEITLKSDLQNATVTFNTDGGSVVDSKSVIVGMTIGSLPTSTDRHRNALKGS